MIFLEMNRRYTAVYYKCAKAVLFFSVFLTSNLQKLKTISFKTQENTKLWETKSRKTYYTANS